MYNIILKIISVTGLSFLAVVLFFIGQFPLIEGKYLWNKYIDTQFAKDYSPEKFELIKVGMELNEVVNIIGEPLTKYNGDTPTLIRSYSYTENGKLQNSLKERPKWNCDFAWYRSVVNINSEDIVISIDKGWMYN